MDEKLVHSPHNITMENCLEAFNDLEDCGKKEKDIVGEIVNKLDQLKTENYKIYDKVRAMLLKMFSTEQEADDKKDTKSVDTQSLDENMLDVKKENILDLKKEENIDDKKEDNLDVKKEENIGGKKEDDLAVKNEDNWTPENITGEVKAAAEQAMSNSGFIFDRKSGCYYNHAEQCFYIPDYKLYYYHQSGAYYYYDETSKNLKYYSTAMTTADLTAAIKNTVIPPQYQNKAVSLAHKPQLYNASPFARAHPFKSSDHDKEDGECSEDDSWMTTPIIFESGPKKPSRKRKHMYAPCIRIIVRKTELASLSVGTLFIITCSGGTLGREGRHDIIIPDINVSKQHAKFIYGFKDGRHFYEAVDIGSRNGTYLDGSRLSDSMKESQPIELKHGNVLKVGCTELLCHIHDGNDTCNECEPSCAGFDPNEIENRNKNQKGFTNLKESFKHESNQIRKKFGLTKDLDYSDIKLPAGYEDKAESRRVTEGSTHDSEKTEAASVDIPINKKNKGFAMMEKLGWKEGDSLGKPTSQGITAPIDVAPKGDKRGLGSDLHAGEVSTQPNFINTKKADILNKTAQRYYELKK